MKFAKQILGEKLFTKLMRASFYGHFVAGEDELQITPVLDRLRQFGVKPILDYSVEEDISQEEAERREMQYVSNVKRNQFKKNILIIFVIRHHYVPHYLFISFGPKFIFIVSCNLL